MPSQHTADMAKPHTGGGCTAWLVTTPAAPGLHALITDRADEVHAPTESTRAVIVGLYDGDPETDGAVGSTEALAVIDGLSLTSNGDDGVVEIAELLLVGWAHKGDDR